MTHANHLTHLHTPLGVRTLQNSVAFCNRCGLCSTACPAYETLRQETFSPRGHNQTLRLIFEGKLRPRSFRASLEEIVRSCSLCGRCTQACPGKIPTAEHMLELRRILNLNILPGTLRAVMRWRAGKPRLFRVSMSVARGLQRAGLLRWGSMLPGFSWLKYACEILPTKYQTSFTPTDVEKPTLIYLPSLEAEFLHPQLAAQVYQKSAKKYRVRVWKNTPSGLFEYLYGDVRQSRKQLRRLITLHKQTGKLPLLTDSFDVYRFLKQAPQLFEGFPQWQTEAVQFAKQVKFVTDLWPKTLKQKSSVNSPVYFMPSVLFDAGSEPLLQIAEKLHTLFKKNFVQCGYRDAAVAPAAYGFVCPRPAQKIALQAVETLARHQVQTVFVPTGLSFLELSALVRRFYPTVRVCHLVELEG